MSHGGTCNVFHYFSMTMAVRIPRTAQRRIHTVGGANMRKRILIVDDQFINRKILGKLLCDQYDILEAENGQTALAILNEQGDTISAILLDLIMPEMDGYAVLETIAHNAKMSAIPVIVASQTDKNQTEEKALRLGARDFVAKPYNPAVLRKRLANLIELYETNTTLLHIERGFETRFFPTALPNSAGTPERSTRRQSVWMPHPLSTVRTGIAL